MNRVKDTERERDRDREKDKETEIEKEKQREREKCIAELQPFIGQSRASLAGIEKVSASEIGNIAYAYLTNCKK